MSDTLGPSPSTIKTSPDPKIRHDGDIDVLSVGAIKQDN